MFNGMLLLNIISQKYYITVAICLCKDINNKYILHIKISFYDLYTLITMEDQKSTLVLMSKNIYHNTVNILIILEF